MPNVPALRSNKNQTPGYAPAPVFLYKTPFQVLGDIIDLPAVVQTINEYFAFCESSLHFPTFTGLALSLGTTRKDLKRFISKNPEIQLTVDRAKQRIVEYVEQLMLSGRPPIGLMFWLKNNDDWVDVKEMKHSEKSMSEILDELEQKHNTINLPIEGTVVK